MAIRFPSRLEAERPEDLAPEGDHSRIVAVARIGKVDGELRLDPRRPLAEHDHARREQHRLLDIVGDENGGEPLVPPQRQKFALQASGG